MVNGNELCDLSTDPGQKNNIAAVYPAKVEEFRKAYSVWWSDISRHSDEFNRVVVGSKQQTVVCLTAHDFFALDVLPAWNQNMIRMASGGNGPWQIKVATAGRYRVSLQRYPRESGLPLDTAAPVPPAEPGVDSYPSRKPILIRKAQITIGGINKEMAVQAQSESVDFEIYLPSVDTALHTVLTDEQGQ